MRARPLECGSLVVILLWAFAGTAWSKQAPATAPPPAAQETARTPVELAVTDVIPASARTLIRLRGIRSRLDADDSVNVVEAALPGFAAQLDEWWRAETETIRQLRSGPRLNDVLFQWRLYEGQVASWNVLLAARSRDWSKEEETLDQLIADWEATRLALKDTTPLAVSSKVAEVLRESDAARDQFQEKTAELVAVQGRLAESMDRLNEIREEIEEARQHLSVDMLTLDAPPLWTALFSTEGTRPVGAEILESTAKLYKEAVNHFRFYRAALLVHIALFVALVALFLGIRRVSLQNKEVTLMAAERVVLERSFFSALLAAVLCAPLIYPEATPQTMRMLVNPAIIPMLALLPAIFTSRHRIGFYFLAAIFPLDFWRYSLPPQWLLGRLLLLAEAFLGIAGAVLMLSVQKVEPSPHPVAVRYLLRIAAVLFAGTAIASTAGNLTLAEALLSPLVRVLFLALLIRLGAVVATTFSLMALRTPLALLSRTVRDRGPAVAARVRSLANVAAGGLWVFLAMYNFGILANAQIGFRNFLELQWKVGAAEISVRDLAVFTLVFAFAYIVSRFLRFILAEEIFPRFQMPRGVPDALELLSRYGVLLFGFLFALTSAGVNLSQVTIAISALGVGIGFGLQNIVNNFVCGLILVFEHPIQVGDFVEVGPHYGRVDRIGFRSSQVSTLDGAEVIIPNAELIGNRVINWSLSDGLRKIAVPVPVPIGTDPKRVIEILEEVARRQSGVASSPAPSAALEKFGDSSLRFVLSCWTRSEGFGLVVQALSLEINKALQKAGIQIPFPQTDVHVHWPQRASMEIPPAEKLK